MEDAVCGFRLLKTQIKTKTFEVQALDASISQMARIIKDCIYKFITIPELCMHFIDTPEFQRLKRVKQLGLVHHVFPSAVHTRFEHSIGVMHLAGEVIDAISIIAPVPQRTKELVQLAGLYHDIGHFAFSHLFDIFLHENIKQDASDSIFELIHHEDRSTYFLKKVNERLGLLSEHELLFVGACIHGDYLEGYPPFLFEVVSDKKCGLDVDRQDYINRDAYHCGFPSFQSDYIIQNTILSPDGHLAYKVKCKRDVRDFFDARQRMFENVYFHHAVQKIDKMMLCAMKRLGDKIFAYGEMTDDQNIEVLLRNSDETKEIMEMIDTRHLTHACSFCDLFGAHNIISNSQFEHVTFQ